MEENGDVDGLIHALNDDSENVRREAIMALERIGDFRATEPLIQILQDNDTLQEEATTALGRIAVDPFIKDLQNQDQKYRDNVIIALNQLRELKISEKEFTTNSKMLKSSEDEIFKERNYDEISKKERFMEDKGVNQGSNESDFDIKSKELVKTGYNIYIENFVKNSRYNYIDGFTTKSRYDYEFTDIRKLRDFIKYRGLDFSDEEVIWLIEEEIKNQEYLEFKEKIMAQSPENLTDYIEILINTYAEPKDHTENLKKLLNEQNLKHHGKLTEEIEKTHKQLEIKNSKTN